MCGKLTVTAKLRGPTASICMTASRRPAFCQVGRRNEHNQALQINLGPISRKYGSEISTNKFHLFYTFSALARTGAPIVAAADGSSSFSLTCTILPVKMLLAQLSFAVPVRSFRPLHLYIRVARNDHLWGEPTMVGYVDSGFSYRSFPRTKDVVHSA